VIDPNTGDDMKCDSGDNDCPPNNLCHRTETFAVCCPNLGELLDSNVDQKVIDQKSASIRLIADSCMKPHYLIA